MYEKDGLILSFREDINPPEDEIVEYLKELESCIRKLNKPYGFVFDARKFNISPKVKRQSLKLQEYTLSDPLFVESAVISPN